MNEPIPKAPNTIPWPPILLAASLAAAFTLDWLVLSLPPIPFAETRLAFGLGMVLIAAAIALFVWARATLLQAGTTILPHRPSSALVKTGPFAFSRNPIYLANVLVLTGLALLLNKLAFLIVVPLFAVAVTFLAIRREERYLLDRFGDEWADYADRVRRWL